MFSSEVMLLFQDKSSKYLFSSFQNKSASAYFSLFNLVCASALAHDNTQDLSFFFSLKAAVRGAPELSFPFGYCRGRLSFFPLQTSVSFLTSPRILFYCFLKTNALSIISQTRRQMSRGKFPFYLEFILAVASCTASGNRTLFIAA